MLILQNISYAHPNKELLLDRISLSIHKHEKIALTGNNGTGKSTLLRVMAGMLQPSGGTIKADTKPYYIPQLLGQLDHHTIAGALQIELQLKALQEILDGTVTDANLALLDDDWGLEERCREAFSYWQLDDLDLTRKMSSLSGGQKTKVLLSGIMIHQPRIVLMDEPSNHLDTESRAILYNYISTCTHALVVVSHDITLLHLVNTVCELSKHGISTYGGNYDFYAAQKAIEQQALQDDLDHTEKMLRKAKETERASLERQQKLDARGKKKQEKSGLPTIAINTLRNNAEKSTARMKEVHAQKTAVIASELDELRKTLPDKDKMKMGFGDSPLHRGKILLEAKNINYNYGSTALWATPLSFRINSGDRLAIRGANGSGKTTLIHMMLGQLQPSAGTLYRADAHAVYMDQDYSLIDNRNTVYGQAQLFNTAHLQEHELKSRLNRFLFSSAHWDQSCAALSGGERMRLILCCMTISSFAPDIIILDEPTNNLDIQNTEILTAAVNEYTGTLIVVSHDAHFLGQVQVRDTLDLTK